MPQNWNINPATGDYVLEGGAPVQTNSLTVPAYIRLKTKRESWLYAPTEDYGSDFNRVKRRPTGRDLTALETIGARALSPLVDDNRASEIIVSTQEVARHGVGLQIDIFDQNGQFDQLVLPSIGV